MVPFWVTAMTSRLGKGEMAISMGATKLQGKVKVYAQFLLNSIPGWDVIGAGIGYHVSTRVDSEVRAVGIMQMVTWTG